MFVSGSGARGLALSFTLPGRDALELAVPIAFVSMSEPNLRQVQDNMLEEFERGLGTTTNVATNQVSENNASQASTLSREWESVSIGAVGAESKAVSAAVQVDPWQGQVFPKAQPQAHRPNEELWRNYVPQTQSSSSQAVAPTQLSTTPQP